MEKDIIIKGRTWKSSIGKPTRDSDMVVPRSDGVLAEFENDYGVVLEYLAEPVYIGSAKVRKYTIYNKNGNVSYRFTRKPVKLDDTQLYGFEKGETIAIHAPARVRVNGEWHHVVVFHNMVVGVGDFGYFFRGEQTPTPYQVRASANPSGWQLTPAEERVEENIRQQITRVE